MPDPIKVSRALLDTVSAMADGNPDWDEMGVESLDFSEPTDLLPPNAVVASQLCLTVEVDDEQYAVVAYKVAP